MRTPFDRLAKWVLVPILERLGEVTTEAEIVEIGQRADLFFRPRLGQLEGDLVEAGVIASMARMQSLWEYFYKTVSVSDFKRCLNKQRNWTDGSERRTGRADQGRVDPGTVLRAKPRLWILTTGRPKKLLDKQPHFHPDGWPEGFLQLKDQDVGLVVLCELSATPETRILRLLGRRAVQFEAMRELVDASAAHSATELERAVLSVMRRHGDFMNQPARTKKEKSMLQEILEWQDNYDRQLREEGRKEGQKKGREQGLEEGLEEGQKKGRKDVLVRQLEQKFGELPAPRRAQLAKADLGELSAWQDRVLVAKSLDEVFGERPPPIPGRERRSRRGGR